MIFLFCIYRYPNQQLYVYSIACKSFEHVLSTRGDESDDEQEQQKFV